MKKTFLLSFVLLTSVLLFESCKKEDPDDISPVITLNGSQQMTIPMNSVFTDPGATATDNVDGNLTNKITVTGSVNTSVAGTYQLVYSVSDAAGNTASANRQVTVESQQNNYIGSYTVSNTCSTFGFGMASSVTTEAGTANNEIIIRNLYPSNGEDLHFTYSGSTITVPSQVLSIFGGPTVSGSGSLSTSGTITLNLQYTNNSSSENCTVTLQP